MQFRMQRQLENKWCWAAVSEAVNRYFTPATPLTQCSIASQVLGDSRCCQNPVRCNRVETLQKALASVGKFKSFRNGAISFPEVRDEIDQQRPVAVRIGWHAGGGHFVVITGYREMASGSKVLDVADSAFGSSSVRYEAFVASYLSGRVRQGGGRWTDTFFVGV